MCIYFCNRKKWVFICPYYVFMYFVKILTANMIVSLDISIIQLNCSQYLFQQLHNNKKYYKHINFLLHVSG
jgi:hypothetical protein